MLSQRLMIAVRRATDSFRDFYPGKSAPVEFHRAVDLSLIVRVTILALAIKLLGFLAFPRVGFFFGDSASYLYTALTGWTPTDRSFVYGELLGLMFRMGLPFESVIWLNIFASALTCGVVTLIITEVAPDARLLGAIAGIMYAIEPIAWLYDAYLMTEPTSTLMILTGLWLCLRFVRRATDSAKFVRSTIELILGVTAFGAAMSLRASALPLLYATMVLPLFLFAFARVRKPALAKALGGSWLPGVKATLAYSAVALIAGSTAIFIYTSILDKRLKLAGLTPTGQVLPEAGLFLAGIALPIIKCSDLTALPPNVSDQLCARLQNDKTVADRHARPVHRWMNGGALVEAVSLAERSGYTTLSVMRPLGTVAETAILRDPIGFAGIGVGIWTDAWTDEYSRAAMEKDSGNVGFPVGFAEELWVKFHYRIDDLSSYGKTFRQSYFFAALPWLRALMLTPLVAFGLTLLAYPEQRMQLATLSCYTAVIFAPAIFLAENLLFRYLHPTAPLFIIIVTLVLNNIINRGKLAFAQTR